MYERNRERHLNRAETKLQTLVKTPRTATPVAAELPRTLPSPTPPDVFKLLTKFERTELVALIREHSTIECIKALVKTYDLPSSQAEDTIRWVKARSNEVIDAMFPDSEAEEDRNFDSQLIDTPFERRFLRPVYDGAHISVLTQSYSLLRLASQTNASTKTKEMMFLRDKAILPQPNFALQYPAVKRWFFMKAGIVQESWDMCPSGCVLYRDQPERFHTFFGGAKYKLASATVCPECGEPRSQDGVTIRTTITPFKEQLYARSLSDAWTEATQHPETCTQDDTDMRTIFDTPAYARFRSKYPQFCERDFGHLMAFMCDGLVPNLDSKLSLFIIMLKDCCLPPWLLCKSHLFFLFAVIPREPRNIRGVQIRLIEDFIDLWYSNPSDSLYGCIKAALWLILGDLPALSIACELYESGAYAPFMKVWNRATRVGDGSRMECIQARRYLPVDHPWRRDMSFGPFEERGPPLLKTSAQVVAHALKISQTENEKDKAAMMQATGIRGLTVMRFAPPLDQQCAPAQLQSLGVADPGLFSDFMPKILHDHMHCTKGVDGRFSKRMFGIDIPKPIKGSQIAEARNQAIEIAKSMTLKKVELKKRDRVWLSIEGPIGFMSHSITPSGTLRTKGHKISMQQVIWGTDVGKLYYKDVHKERFPDLYPMMVGLNNSIQKISKSPLYLPTKTEAGRRTTAQVHIRLAEALAIWEKIMPKSDCPLVVAEWLSIFEAAVERGPGYISWGYSWERFLSRIKNKINDRAHPVANLFNVHGLDSALQAIAALYPVYTHTHIHTFNTPTFVQHTLRTHTHTHTHIHTFNTPTFVQHTLRTQLRRSFLVAGKLGENLPLPCFTTWTYGVLHGSCSPSCRGSTATKSR